MDLASVVTEAADHMSSPRMTYVPLLAPEGKEQAVALEKGTVESDIHAVEMDR